MMKRRKFIQTIAAAPAVPAIAAAQQPAASGSAARPAETEVPRLEVSVADQAGEMTPRFFAAAQFAALRKLSEIIMPPIKGAPGAIEARAPEFLDFLIGASPAERQQLYRTGLDLLNANARKQFAKTFAEVDAAQAAKLLAPLRESFTFDPPADTLARFLRAAKADIRTATMNSREYASAAAGGRRGAGVGLYWYPLD